MRWRDWLSRLGHLLNAAGLIVVLGWMLMLVRLVQPWNAPSSIVIDVSVVQSLNALASIVCNALASIACMLAGIWNVDSFQLFTC